MRGGSFPAVTQTLWTINSMAGCILSATGKEFNVDSFLESSVWQNIASVFHKGDKTRIKQRPYKLFSGLQIDITSLDTNVEFQVKEAMAFLEKYDTELQRLRAFSNVEEIELKIGTFWYSDTVCSIVSLPPRLLSLAVRHNIEISISIYATMDDDLTPLESG